MWPVHAMGALAKLLETWFASHAEAALARWLLAVPAFFTWLSFMFTMAFLMPTGRGCEVDRNALPDSRVRTFRGYIK